MKNKGLNKGYLTIREFSKYSGISAASLRHYDRKGVFRSALHGIGSKNNHRYYAPMQITTVKLIRVLTEIGVPLETIKELANSRTPEQLLKLLSKQDDIVADKIRFLRQAQSVIGMRLALLDSGMRAIETEIHAAELPEQRIILGDQNDFEGSDSFYGAFTRFLRAQHEQNRNLCYPVGGYFESMEAFMSAPSKPARFFTLDPEGQERMAAALYLVGYARGYYGNTDGLPERMAEYADRNGLVFTGPVYNIYLFDEISVVSPDDYLLRVCVSVHETGSAPARRPRRHY